MKEEKKIAGLWFSLVFCGLLPLASCTGPGSIGSSDSSSVSGSGGSSAGSAGSAGSGTVGSSGGSAVGSSGSNQCSGGLQDNDNNGTCLPTCRTAQLTCTHGQCSDATGTAACACESGYAGERCDVCATGFQDNDKNGICLPACSAGGITCPAQATCNDASGTARCICAAGFTDDGQGNCVQMTFSSTATAPDLDNSDVDDFITCMSVLGYKQDTIDRAATKASFIKILQKNTTFLWHTGHGDTGKIYFADDSYITSSTTQVNVKYSMYITCYTHADTTWKNAFGPAAQLMGGYTGESMDDADNQTAKNFCKELKAGRTPLQAWYLANKAVSDHAPIWLAFARETGGIVEYSARSQKPPAVTYASGDLIPQGNRGNLRVSRSLLSDATQNYGATFSGLVRTTTPNQPETQIGVNGLSELKPCPLSESEAVLVAESTLRERGELPGDATLGPISRLEKRIDSSFTPILLGYEIRFQREAFGLPVRGNSVDHHLSVLVGADGVVSTSKLWPRIVSSSDAGAWKGKILPLRDAIALGAEKISARVKCNCMDVTEARPVYGAAGQEGQVEVLEPAYELISAGGASIVISALTGQPL